MAKQEPSCVTEHRTRAGLSKELSQGLTACDQPGYSQRPPAATVSKELSQELAACDATVRTLAQWVLDVSKEPSRGLTQVSDHVLSSSLETEHPAFERGSKRSEPRRKSYEAELAEAREGGRQRGGAKTSSGSAAVTRTAHASGRGDREHHQWQGSRRARSQIRGDKRPRSSPRNLTRG